MISIQETDIGKISSVKTANCFYWGNNCTGWWLKEKGQFSVILETIPKDSSETKHFHKNVEQFFYVLDGILSIELEDNIYHLKQDEGMTISPQIVHRVFNQFENLVKFLVISCPDTREDRVNLELIP